MRWAWSCESFPQRGLFLSTSDRALSRWFAPYFLLRCNTSVTSVPARPFSRITPPKICVFHQMGLGAGLVECFVGIQAIRTSYLDCHPGPYIRNGAVKPRRWRASHWTSIPPSPADVLGSGSIRRPNSVDFSVKRLKSRAHPAVSRSHICPDQHS